MKCPKCGRENVPGTPFCADCGKNLFASDVCSAGAPDPAETTRSSEQAPSASSTPSEPALQAESTSVVVQPAEIFVQGIAPEPEESPADAMVDSHDARHHRWSHLHRARHRDRSGSAFRWSLGEG